MRRGTRRMRGVVVAGLVAALGCVAPAAVAQAYEAGDDSAVITPQASSTVYVNPHASGEADTYATVEGALENVADGGTIAFRDNVKINSVVTLSKDVTLDLGGHTIEGPSMFSLFIVEENHSVVVDGAGTLQSIHDHVFILHGALSVVSGTFVTPLGHEALYNPQGTGSAIILGGTFPTPVAPESCADGYAPRMVVPGDASAGYTVGRALARPTPVDRVYDGTEQYGCDATEGLLLSGGGTNVGDYTTTATPDDGYAWELASGLGSMDAQEDAEAGTAPVTLAWRMAPKQLDASMAHADDQTYNGKPQTPVMVADGATMLTEGTDYRVTYADNTNVGTASYTVAGAGNFAGEVSGTFAINPANIADATFAKIADRTYTGRAVEPGVVASFGGAKLIEGTDYELAYANNTKVGTAAITVRGKGNFQGETTRHFAIVPARSSSGTSGTTTSGYVPSTRVATSSSQGSSSALPHTADQGPVNNVLCALVSGAIALVAGARRRQS